LLTGLRWWMAALRCRLLNVAGVAASDAPVPVEFSSRDASIIDHVLDKQLTMVSRQRLYATVIACKHVVSERVPGSFVECGVWRGGSSLVAADVFSREDPTRCLYLLDTFAGMTEPTSYDLRASDGRKALPRYVSSRKDTHSDWCYASLAEVRAHFAELDLLGPNVKFVEGDVVESLKHESNLPGAIAVLRLDTDWYESTLAELQVLYPRLSPGGVLIIDDYGHWSGAKRAVDEYFHDHPRPLLQYTDYTGRMGVKPV
jgi:O-methyltransferase